MRITRAAIAACLVITAAACSPAAGPTSRTSATGEPGVAMPDPATATDDGSNEDPGDDPGAGATCVSPSDPTVASPSVSPDLGPFPWDRPDPVVAEGFDATEIIPGGPPPDGIEPIDAPCFDDVAVADRWLNDDSPVMVLEHRGATRIYPLAIMTQHEVVNDVVGGDPVVATYCPLCNSGLAFRRTVDETVLDFGTSGRLYRSNLVMYDRQTRTLWTQFDGLAVMGVDHVGTRLQRLATSHLGWADARAAAPDAMVLSPDTRPERDYGRNPYPGYEGNGDAFLFRGPRDDRIGPNTRVLGLGTDQPVAITASHLRDEGVVEVEVDDTPVTVWWAPGQASALDAPRVDDGRDVGSAVAFDRRLEDGTLVSMTASDDATFVDEVSGSRFDLLGEAVDGPLAGTSLRPVAHDDTFWFVWFAFRPDTDTIPDFAD